MPIDYDKKYMNILKEIVLSAINPEKVMVFVFGSRAGGHHKRSSDIDIGLLADDKLPVALYHRLRNTIDESIVPWKVDIIDFTRVDSSFKKDALKDIVIWNRPAAMKSVVSD
jgi:predicted nucleotidyltransferase